MRYLGRIAGFAFQRSLLRTDIFAAVLTALAPVSYFLAEEAMPEDIALHISMLVAALLIGVLILRIITAPYFIWKEDQARISELTQELEEPKRKRKEAFQSRFDDDRAAFLKALVPILTDLRKLNEIPEHAAAIIDRFYPQAAGFMFDPDFKYYWFTFEKNLKGWQAVNDYVQSASGELSTEEQLKVMARVGLHANMVSASVGGMVAFLGMSDDHRASFDADIATTSKHLGNVDFSFAQPERKGFNERPSLYED